MKKNASYKDIWKELTNAKSIITFMHGPPDLDSAASCLAVKYLLEKLGKKVTIYSVDGVPEFMNTVFDDNELNCVIEKDPSEIEYNKYDLILGLDFDKPIRVTEEVEFAFPKSVNKVVIDHHETNTYWGDINLVQPEATSTCTVLYNLLTGCKVKIDKNLANILLVGLLADTGIFSNLGTSPVNLLVAYNLAQLGADYNLLIWKMLYNQKYYLLKLKAQVLNNLQIKHVKDISYVISSLSLDELEKCKVPEGERVFVSDMIKTIEGIDFAIVLKEKDDGSFTVSMRSNKLDFDVSNIATSVFSGGGHPQAAGGIIRNVDTMKEALDYAVSSIKKYMESL